MQKPMSFVCQPLSNIQLSNLPVMSHFRNVRDKTRCVWQGTERNRWCCMEGAPCAAGARAVCSHTKSSAGATSLKQYLFAEVDSEMDLTQGLCNLHRVSLKGESEGARFKKTSTFSPNLFLNAKYENKMAERKTVLPLLLCPRGQLHLQK